MRTKRLRSLLDAMRGRRIRNTHVRFMRDGRHISLWHQVRWWYLVYRPAHARGEKYGWLFYDGDRPVGYGGVSFERDRWWVTAGLVPEAEGRGFGRWMFEYITEWARDYKGDGDVWLEVFAWNARARRLYETMGYVYVDAEWSGDTLTMVKRR